MQTIIFFSVGALIIVGAIICWFWLFKQPEIKAVLYTFRKKDGQVEKPKSMPLCKLFNKIALPITSIYLLYVVTLTIFPSYTAMIPSNHLFKKKKYG